MRSAPRRIRRRSLLRIGIAVFSLLALVASQMAASGHVHADRDGCGTRARDAAERQLAGRVDVGAFDSGRSDSHPPKSPHDRDCDGCALCRVLAHASTPVALLEPLPVLDAVVRFVAPLAPADVPPLLPPREGLARGPPASPRA